MTAPNDPAPEVSIDPSDPRWVEDILDRARKRAEESRRPAAAPPAPITPAALAPASIAAPAPITPAPAPITPAPITPAPIMAAPLAPENPRPRPNPRPGTDTNPWASLDEPTAATAPATGSMVDAHATTLVATLDSPAPDDPATDVDAVESTTMDRRVRGWLEWGGVILGALLVAFVIRAVLFQAFYIPSESMESTLQVKDRILVNKLSYKLHDVHRGDIVVFEKPPGETSKINDLIKRVVALPGETLEQQGNDIYIDLGSGPQKLTESYIKDPQDIGQPIGWVQGCANPSTERNKCTIPAGHVWVMGDNRGHSHDSRVFGPIDEDLIVGRAFVKVWPLNKIGFL